MQPESLALRTIVSPFHIEPDHGTKTFIISSAAYSPTDDGAVSIDLEQLLSEDGIPITGLYPVMKNAVALLANSVMFVRGLELSILHEPVSHNWYHGGIRGNLTRGKRRNLANAKNYIEIVPLDIEAAKAHWEAIRGPLHWGPSEAS